MKKNGLFITAIISLIFTAIPNLLFANELANDIEKLNKSLLPAIQKGQIDTNDDKVNPQRNYLDDSPFDYLNASMTLYPNNNSIEDHETVAPLMMKERELISFLEYQVAIVAADETKLPSLYDQFNIMSYLMYTGQNDYLKKLLQRGYTWDLYINLYLPDEDKHVNLLSQAVLCNNKEALKIIDDTMREKAISLGKNEQEVKRYLAHKYHYALQILTYSCSNDNFYLNYDRYDQKYLDSIRAYATEHLDARSIAKMVIEDNSATLYQYDDIIYNKQKGEGYDLFFDALNLLIDYRTEGKI